MIRARERDELTVEDFPPPRDGASPLEPPLSRILADRPIDFKALVGRYERSLIEQALEVAEGNKNKAAQLLGLKRTTLLEKLKRIEE